MSNVKWQMANAKSDAPGDRRLRRRYPLALALEYKMMLGSEVLRRGSGATVDLSSGGVLFQCAESLPPQACLELRIAWPFLFEGVRRLQLAVRGRVVRSDERGTAVCTSVYEFRLCGMLRPVRAQ